MAVITCLIDDLNVAWNINPIFRIILTAVF